MMVVSEPACGTNESPEITSLMMSTPSRIISRVSRRYSSGPSAISAMESTFGMCRVRMSPRPPVTVNQGVAASSLGPGISPFSMALRMTTSSLGLAEAALMQLVMPWSK